MAVNQSEELIKKKLKHVVLVFDDGTYNKYSDVYEVRKQVKDLTLGYDSEYSVSEVVLWFCYNYGKFSSDLVTEHTDEILE